MLTKFYILVLCLISMGAQSNSPKILDLTYPFNSKTNYWPTEKGFQLEQLFYGQTPGGYFYSAYKFCTPEHGGTHVDAPRHFSEQGHTVDQIPVEQLTGNAVVINVTDKVKNNPDYAITAQDIMQFEKENRPLNAQDIVLFYTGWGQYWDNKKKYLGSDIFGDVKNLHFPGLSKHAAEYLVSRKVKGLGIDTASMDPGNSKEFWTHRVVSAANLFGIENLAHLDKLPALGNQLIVAPMKIEGGSGAPARIYALDIR